MKIQLSDHFDYKRLLRFVAPSILMLLWLFCIQLCGKDAFRRPESGDAGADGRRNDWIHGRYRRKCCGIHDSGRGEKGTGE